MKNFPTLYQKTTVGAIQRWDIHVEPDSQGGVIVTRFGQDGGKIQETRDLVTEGKNAGKKNATTPYEQACRDAQGKWDKKKKSGYVESLETATAGEVDTAVVLGGIEPMLAPNKSYPKDDDLQKRIKFPCFSQKKFDGIRCTTNNAPAVEPTLWSRTRKPINSVPHIVAELKRRFPVGELKLDGELYNHAYKAEFEDLLSIVRQDEPDAEGLYKVMQLHCYDLPLCNIPGFPKVDCSTPYHQRIKVLSMLLAKQEDAGEGDVIFCAETRVARDMKELLLHFEEDLGQGYEGSMAKNQPMVYRPGSRSPDQQKMKMFEDHEFRVTKANEGRGKAAGKAITFTCQLPCLCCGLGAKPGPDGKPVTFEATHKAGQKVRKKYMDEPELWQNKALTVTMKRWTADGIPYIPNTKAFRDYE